MITDNNKNYSMLQIPSIRVSVGLLTTSWLNEDQREKTEKLFWPQNIIKHKINLETSVKKTRLDARKGFPRIFIQ